MTLWKKIVNSGLVLAAGIAVSGPANAIIIDDFNTVAQLVSADPPPVPNTDSSEVATANSLGGFRDLFAEVTASPFFTNLDVEADNNVLSVSAGGGVEGSAAVTWDGNDNDGANVDIDGLGGLDLTDGGASTGFDLNLLTIDLDVIVSLTAWDMGGNVDTASFMANMLNDDSFAFSAFSGVDFSNIGALQLGFQSTTPAFDVVVTLLETNNVGGPGGPVPVPLPGTALLFGVGLVGLRLFKSRIA